MRRVIICTLLAAIALGALAAGQTTAAPEQAVGVVKYGPPSATRVLVLVPGSGGSGGSFSEIGPALVAHVPNLQVWATDRRGDAFTDLRGFASGNSTTPYDYYFSHKPLGGASFDANVASKHPEARGWGLSVALADLRKIVLEARAGGRRKVILGGHSIGAATALAYAAWDFGGRAGYRDLAGLVLIDGGELGTFGTPSLAQAKAGLAKLKTQATPFNDRLGIGAPWIFGVLGQIGALYALSAPNAPSVLAANPLVPAQFRPPGSPTNADFFAYAAKAASIDVAHCGLTEAAKLVAAEPQTLSSWYYPTRLDIDLIGAASLRSDPVTRLLGLASYLKHLSAIDLPLYAFATGDVPTTLAGARAFLAQSRSPRSAAVLAQDPTLRHVDPLCVPYPKSRFLRTVAPWLAKR
jgi:pimeloyl-ACP methyl ester carboxylesterase